jgi:hypothetical protein
MKWTYVQCVEPCPTPCGVCGRHLPDPTIRGGDIIYSPAFRDGDEWRADAIERIWNVDPYADFAVCEECMEGHCGAVPGKNANNWLARKAAAYDGHLSRHHEQGRTILIGGQNKTDTN